MINKNDANRFLEMIFHDDRNSRYALFHKAADKSQCHMFFAKDIDVSEINTADSYISLNGFIYKRETSYCRQINGLFFDFDLHCLLKNIEWEMNHFIIYVNDAIADGILPKPNIIVDSGRGLHIYYIFNNSVPYHLINGDVNQKGLSAIEIIRAGLSEIFEQLLIDSNSKIKSDSCVTDVTRLVRIPGTYNTESKSYARIIDYDEDYYFFSDFDRYLKNNNSTKKKSAKKTCTTENKNLQLIRIKELEELQRHRNYECLGCRDSMDFLFYNAAVQIYGRTDAFQMLKLFNNSFVDSAPITETDLKAIARCIEKNTGSNYTGHYKIKKDWIIDRLGITEKEIKELGLFKSAKREEQKQNHAEQKALRNKEISQMYLEGYTQKQISDAVKVSVKTIQNVLKFTNNKGKKKSDRNLKIFKMADDGIKSADIAEKMNISLRTVQYILKSRQVA